VRSMLLAVVVLASTTAAAQELEARSYSLSPIGTTFVIGGFGRSQGPIVLDPSLDVDNVEGDLWITTLGVGHVFALAGRQGRILAVVPIASGDVAGALHGRAERQPLTGAVDPRVKLSVGLHGAPALTLSEFARAPRRSLLVGASLTVAPPWGQYKATQLVNLGYNRWAFKPEVGASRQIARWTVEGIAGVWLFTENHEYFPGTVRRRQEPLASWQGHISYSLPHRSWAAVDITGFAGGQTRVDQARNPDEQRNARLGATFSVPLPAQQSLKFVYSQAAATARGSGFTTLNVTWQLVRLGSGRARD
jgi:outer membrane putative beta-barrel porin/alpha-amylase